MSTAVIAGQEELFPRDREGHADRHRVLRADLPVDDPGPGAEWDGDRDPDPIPGNRPDCLELFGPGGPEVLPPSSLQPEEANGSPSKHQPVLELESMVRGVLDLKRFGGPSLADDHPDRDHGGALEPERMNGPTLRTARDPLDGPGAGGVPLCGTGKGGAETQDPMPRDLSAFRTGELEGGRGRGRGGRFRGLFAHERTLRRAFGRFRS